MLRDSARMSAQLAVLLASAGPQTSRLDEHVESLRVSCRDCHKRYREQKPE